MNLRDKINYEKAANYRKIITEAIPPGSIIPAHTSEGHFYKVGDKLYGSVTGKLQVLKDPSLANWKMNRALDYVWNKLALPNQDSFEIPNLEKTIAEAKNAPQEIFEDAGDIGTQIHDDRQKYFQDWIDKGERPELTNIQYPKTQQFPINIDTDPRRISAFRALNKFCDDTGYIPVATELLLWSEKLGVAGTLDDLGIINGKLVLCDLKSSNQFKDTYFLQVAMYYQMLVERTGLKPRECFILKVSKENGTYELEYLKDMRKLVKIAKAVLAVDEGFQFIKQSRKRETIKI